MAQFIGIFERKETKYVLDSRQIAAVKAGLEGKLTVDEYGLTRIDSLYFDTPSRDIISRSLEKPLYKEKLRVRAYGDAGPSAPVFVELKKKFKGIVYKRRMRMSRAGAQAYFSGMSYEHAQKLYPVGGMEDPAAFSAVSIQIAREIDMYRTRYAGLAPSMLISCMREAWKACDPNNPETDVRITFDERISYVDVAGERFDYDGAVAREGRSFALPAGRAVMEIKCAGAYPMWLVELLDACDVRPSSFSKYGTSYQIESERQRLSRPRPRPRVATAPLAQPDRRDRPAVLRGLDSAIAFLRGKRVGTARAS